MDQQKNFYCRANPVTGYIDELGSGPYNVDYGDAEITAERYADILAARTAAPAGSDPEAKTDRFVYRVIVDTVHRVPDSSAECGYHVEAQYGRYDLPDFEDPEIPDSETLSIITTGGAAE